MTTVRTIETFQVPPRWVFVKVTTDDGATGWGECIVPKRVRAVLGAIEDLADNIVGRYADRIEDLWQRMGRGGFFRGGPILSTATAGIEHALWDRKARAAGLAIHDFLGGAVRDRIRAYAWVGGDQPDDVVEHVRQRVAQGFTTVKMNATSAIDHLDRHGPIDEAVARVAAIRDAFGSSVDLALDFHGRVHRSAAKTLLQELQPFRLLWVEEAPIAHHEDGLSELARAAGAIPLATGERLTSRWQFKALFEAGIIDIVQPDVSITGLFELEKIARMAEAYDVAVAPHCPNGPLSLAASLQVGSCCPNVAIQEYSGGIHYHQGFAGLDAGDLADYVHDAGPVSCVEGHLNRPTGPGLGIEVDETAVASARTAWRLPDPDWQHADGRYAEW